VLDLDIRSFSTKNFHEGDGEVRQIELRTDALCGSIRKNWLLNCWRVEDGESDLSMGRRKRPQGAVCIAAAGQTFYLHYVFGPVGSSVASKTPSHG